MPSTDVDIKEEIEKSYLNYSMNVIVGRTIPSIRDGLKPVHRRIIYAMTELGNRYDKPFKKSARIVGDVIGKYHPHSDGAIYDALIRMAQDFNMQSALVDGQGNIGSVDGDKPAAMRYTECRLQKIADEFTKDLNEETVDYRENYDSSTVEPEILPTRIPNLLLNGTSGIAVGMATSIPPHNLNELVDAIIATIKNPAITIEDLCKIVKGPDFPTGGVIFVNDSISETYKTGRGSIKINGVVNIETNPDGTKSIVIKEIPYSVNKTTLIEKIGHYVTEKGISEISEIRDESDRNGIRIVLSLKRNSQEKVIVDGLYKHTPLEASFSINMLCVSDNKPKQINLKDYIEAFIDHRRDIILRRSAFEARKLQQRMHILEGLQIAAKNIDEIIAIVRKSDDSEIAKQKIQKKFKTSEKQTKAILGLSLQRLTKIENKKIKEEHENATKRVKELNSIIDEEEQLDKTINDEMLEIKNEYGRPRRTKILNEEEVEDQKEKILLDSAKLIITLTSRGYIKTTNASEYPTQKRGGKGIVHGSDLIKTMISVDSNDELLLFTNTGKYFILNVEDIPLMSRSAKGKHISGLIDIQKVGKNPFETNSEFVTSITHYKPEEAKDTNLFFATKNGYIKKSPMSLFRGKKVVQGLEAITLRDNDKLLGVEEVTDSDYIMFVSRNSMVLILNCGKIKEIKTTRSAMGFLGMNLKGSDEIISMGKVVYDDEHSIFSVSRNGFGRRVKIEQFKIANRGSVGLSLLKVDEPEKEIAGAVCVTEDSRVTILTSGNATMSMKISDIPIRNRYSIGTKIVNMNDKDNVNGEVCDVNVI